MMFYVQKQFGLFIFRIVKTSLDLREVYWTYTICLTVLKVDVMFQGLLAVSAFTFWGFESAEKIIAAVGIAWAVFTVFICYQGVSSESRWMMTVFFGISFVEPVRLFSCKSLKLLQSIILFCHRYTCLRKPFAFQLTRVCFLKCGNLLPILLHLCWLQSG